jgi:tRNA (guanine37-N1)-methyltransferase
LRSLAIVAARGHGEEVRQKLSELGLLRSDLRIDSSGTTIAFPVVAVPEPPIPGGVLEEREFERLPAPGPRSYRDLLTLPPAETALLPRAFDVIGDIVLVRLPSELTLRGPQIGEALLAFVPGARIVGEDLGVAGVERIRSLRRLAGKGPWTTRHSENGLTFDVDLERAYFSPRLAREHARVAEEIRTGDRVLDLCCGIGPFALTIARVGRARRIWAVDLNPAAIALGRSNAHRLGLADRVEFIEQPIERFVGSAERSERVIFNLPREGIKYLPQVGTTVEPGGSIYYYEVTEMGGFSRRPAELAELLGSAGGTWVPEGARPVHPYSPRQELALFRIRRAS